MSLENLLNCFKAGREFALKDDDLDSVSDESWSYFEKIDDFESTTIERFAFKVGEYSSPRYAFCDLKKKAEYLRDIIEEERRGFSYPEVRNYFKAGRILSNENTKEGDYPELEQYASNFFGGLCSTRLEGFAFFAGLYSRPKNVFKYIKELLRKSKEN